MSSECALCYRMAPNMQPATNGHEPQLDQLPASLEYRLDGENMLVAL